VTGLLFCGTLLRQGGHVDVTVQRDKAIPVQEERVVVVDRMANVRSALFLMLSQQPDITIAGDRGTTDGLLEYLIDVQATILLLDWTLVQNDPAGQMQSFHASCPGLVIIALSTRPEHHPESLHAGAHAFVCKGDEPANLLKLIRGLVRR
jgi:DNA-binding NarL/FixJ family response regulator